MESGAAMLKQCSLGNWPVQLLPISPFNVEKESVTMPSDPQEDGSKANGRPLPFLFSLISWQTTFLLQQMGLTETETGV